MLVVMEAAATAEQIDAVVRHIERLGLRAHPIPGAHRRSHHAPAGRRGALLPPREGRQGLTPGRGREHPSCAGSRPSDASRF